MRALVVQASRFGAAQGIAEGIAATLRLKLFDSRGDKGLSEGDFRDWKEIEAWASSIAETLQAAAAGAAPCQPTTGLL
jgi:menaquinone-dependent protoporphyrinogen IX oxidase